MRPYWALLLAACAGEVQSRVDVVPPPPAPKVTESAAPAPAPETAPAATDADGDGVVEGDSCPDEKETKNGYKDGDGCPDQVPDAYLSGHTIKLKGEIRFSAAGAVDPSSNNLLDAVAKVMADNTDLEKIEVAGYLWGGNAVLRDATSKARAKSVVDALAKRGVDKGRMEVQGYADKCDKNKKGNGARIGLHVTRRGGKSTGQSGACS